MTNAKAALLSKIKTAGGKIPLRDYMGFCLSHPQYGYYSTQKPLGKAGDFITAPEISQIFGELLGLWFVNFWEEKGNPPKVALLELGPGRGLLMGDMLRAMAVRPDILKALTIHQVEINPHLKKDQIAALKPTPVTHHETVHSALKAIGDTPTFLVANEFFDAFPIDQYVYQNDTWHKRYVGHDGTLGDFIFRDEVPADGFGNCAFPMKPAEGTVMETAPLVEGLFRTIAQHIVRTGGAGLIIDYGYDAFGYGDTLQALRRHKSVSVFQNPGQVDLTTHVNFATLLRIAQNCGGLKAGVETQGAFLKELGIEMRTDLLARKAKDPQIAKDLHASTARLVDPSQMGDLFKVLRIWG